MPAEEEKEKAKAEAHAEQERVRREEHEKQLEALRAITGSVTPKVAAGVTSETSTSVADELVKLAQLVERGLLTPDEFSAQKAALLKGRT